MDVFVSSLRASGYKCVNNNFSKPIVVNCVPGAGKSSLIRELIDSDSRFEAVTFGAADNLNLSGKRIKSAAEGFSDSCSYRIVDEYTEGNWRAFEPFAILGDPLQSRLQGKPLQADFISTTTRRFGKETCSLLNKFSFEISSAREDKVEVAGLFEEELRGVVIAADSEVYALAKSHGAEIFCIEEIRGRTFSETTVLVSEESIPDKFRADYYLALTRHKDRLKILSPDASFGSTQLH